MTNPPYPGKNSEEVWDSEGSFFCKFSPYPVFFMGIKGYTPLQPPKKLLHYLNNPYNKALFLGETWHWGG